MKNINLFYGIYIFLTSILFVFLFPAFWIYTRITGKYQRHLRERLGSIPPEKVQNLTGAPRIWIHAVSLGEVVVAAPIIEALKQILPKCSFILSTMTEHGREMAVDTFKNEIPVIYAPIDFVGAVRKAKNILPSKSTRSRLLLEAMHSTSGGRSGPGATCTRGE